MYIQDYEKAHSTSQDFKTRVTLFHLHFIMCLTILSSSSTRVPWWRGSCFILSLLCKRVKYCCRKVQATNQNKREITRFFPRFFPTPILVSHSTFTFTKRFTHGVVFLTHKSIRERIIKYFLHPLVPIMKLHIIVAGAAALLCAAPIKTANAKLNEVRYVLMLF